VDINRISRLLTIAFLFLLINTLTTIADPAKEPSQVIKNTNQRSIIVVHVGQSRLIGSPWPVKRLSVTDPTIADVEAVTPDRVLILGRKLGATDVIMWSEKEEVWEVRIDVSVDLSRIRMELSGLFPRSKLEVVQSQDVIIVTGSLASKVQAEQLRRFLEASDKATGLKYLDMTDLGDSQRRVRDTEGSPDADESYIDPGILGDELVKLFPGSTLNVRRSQGVIVVSGQLRRAEQAEQLHQYLKALEKSAEEYNQSRCENQKSTAGGMQFVNMTSVAGVHQVLLHTRVAEVSRTAIRTLGINVLQPGHHDNLFFGSSQVGPDSGGALNPVTIGPPAGAVAGGKDVPFTFNADVNVSPLTTLLLGFPRADLQFFIQALKENQYLRVLAEPNLVSLSGEEASFLVGGEFPIPVVQGTTTGGGTSISIEYKEFGVRLRFRPTVLGDNTIRLHLAPEVSDLSGRGAVEIEGFRIPAVITRRAEATLELKSGQTFMMAGLLDQRNGARNSRVPGLGDLPILGSLFRSVRYEQGETELVVLVTARLVEPMSLTSAPPVPGILHTPPNDWELYLEGKMESGSLPQLSPADAGWLQELGLDGLKGPGAWARYEQNTATSQVPVTPVRLSEFNNGGRSSKTSQ
jgi:pilus assembly protein CpaC